jgi:hypothetical protein
MKEEVLDIAKKLYHNHLTPEVATDLLLRLFDVSDRHSWLNKDDLEFAVALQEENRLEAVKWLCEKAKGHSITPLKDAKDILDAYR